jgi:hypothetical protein
MADKHEYGLEQNYQMATNTLVHHNGGCGPAGGYFEGHCKRCCVNPRHAVYLSAKAGLSHVASFTLLNLTESHMAMMVSCLSRLFHEVEVEEKVVEPPTKCCLLLPCGINCIQAMTCLCLWPRMKPELPSFHVSCAPSSAPGDVQAPGR